jgi:hypothetical protein
VRISKVPTGAVGFVGFYPAFSRRFYLFGVVILRVQMSDIIPPAPREAA